MPTSAREELKHLMDLALSLVLRVADAGDPLCSQEVVRGLRAIMERAFRVDSEHIGSQEDMRDHAQEEWSDKCVPVVAPLLATQDRELAYLITSIKSLILRAASAVGENDAMSIQEAIRGLSAIENRFYGGDNRRSFWLGPRPVRSFDDMKTAIPEMSWNAWINPSNVEMPATGHVGEQTLELYNIGREVSDDFATEFLDAHGYQRVASLSTVVDLLVDHPFLRPGFQIITGIMWDNWSGSQESGNIPHLYHQVVCVEGGWFDPALDVAVDPVVWGSDSWFLVQAK